jgi:hypothetical protein
MLTRFNRLSNFAKSEDGQLLIDLTQGVAQCGGVIAMFLGMPFTAAGFMAAYATSDTLKSTAKGEPYDWRGNMVCIAGATLTWGLLTAAVQHEFYSTPKYEPVPASTAQQNCKCN